MRTIEQYPNGNPDPKLAAIFRELATLRTENRRLMKTRPATSRYSSTVHRAIVDANMLIMRAWSGDSTGMLATKDATGMSKRRWQWAVALLRYSGIVRTRSRSWRKGLDWDVTVLDDAIAYLEKSGCELQTPDGYSRLKKWRKNV